MRVQVLGPEHLLRLFLRLPELVVESNITKEETEALAAQLGDLLK